jgi:hypothetical protein
LRCLSPPAPGPSPHPLPSPTTLPNVPQNFDGQISGPAIYQFQQVEARGAIFWEPLLLAIGLAESWRVAVGWATPVGNGFNQLKDDYELGELAGSPCMGPPAWEPLHGSPCTAA